MDLFNEEIIQFWKSLKDNEVRYILVGGFAINFHGYQRYTGDLDIWIDDTLENRKKLRKTFVDRDMGDYPMIESMQFVPGWTEFHLNNGLVLDILADMKGLESYSFDKCLQLASIAQIEDVPIPFLHISQLIKNKKAVNRPKDRLDILALQEIEKLDIRHPNILPSEYERLTPIQAIAYQNQLRQQIKIEPLDKEIKIIGGADISFNKFTDIVYAGIVLFKYPELTYITSASVKTTTRFPYISGLLAFREVPALLEVWDKLEIKPDLMVLDGQGIAHERRLGIATHFGLLTDVPTIGSAKSRLSGRYQEPANEVFAQSPMYDQNEVIGIALRSKKNCNPIYISPGHRISMEQSVEVIKNCIRNYRIPEPTRQAHNFVNKVRTDDRQDQGQFSLF